MTTREWVWKRNCSISPRQLAMVYALLCLAPMLVALFFTMHGAWYVLGFAILEMTAVAVAFVQFGRHVGDCEHIALQDNCLLVEFVQAERTRQFRLDPSRTHVDLPADYSALVGLEAGGVRVEVGRFLTQWKRREFARELQCALPGGWKEF